MECRLLIFMTTQFLFSSRTPLVVVCLTQRVVDTPRPARPFPKSTRASAKCTVLLLSNCIEVCENNQLLAPQLPDLLLTILKSSLHMQYWQLCLGKHRY